MLQNDEKFYLNSPHSVNTIGEPNSITYSVLRLATGLLRAAFNALKLTVANAMNMAKTPAAINTHQLNGVLQIATSHA